MARRISNTNSYSESINMKKVPILPLDNRWHMIFSKENKSSHIKKLEDEVMSIVKQESRVSSELKQLAELKKKLIKEIVSNMEEVNNDHNEDIRKKKLEKSQQLIKGINDKIDKLENDEHILPDRLIRANKALLDASIDECYKRIQTNEEQIIVLGQWIEKTRDELKKNVIIKQEKEETNQNIYTYMHDIFGPEFMEIFDKGHN